MDPRPLATFISYSHQDQKQRKKLREHFAQLERDGLVRLWDDREIQVGQEFDTPIRAKLEEAEVFVLLVSADFIASRYCEGIEVKRALERHAEGKALVLPVILKPCDWRHSPLGRLVAAPTDGRPISSWSPRDAGWADVTALMRAAILEFQRRQAGTTKPGADRLAALPSEQPEVARRRPGWRARVALGAVIPAALLVGAMAYLQVPRGEPPQRREDVPDMGHGAFPSGPSGPPVEPVQAQPYPATIAPDAGPAPPRFARPPGPLVSLAVHSEPPAVIKVFSGDQMRASGRSPFTVEVLPGDVVIEVFDPGKDRLIKRESVTIQPLPRRQVRTITVGQGTVMFRSFPASHVTIDGELRGDVPLSLTLYEGTHTVRLECDRSSLACGDKPEVVRNIVVEAGKTQEVVHRWDD